MKKVFESFREINEARVTFPKSFTLTKDIRLYQNKKRTPLFGEWSSVESSSKTNGFIKKGTVLELANDNVHYPDKSDIMIYAYDFRFGKYETAEFSLDDIKKLQAENALEI